MNKTIFIDIDGTILEHPVTLANVLSTDYKPKVLPGVIDKFEEWSYNGHCIVLVTARPETLRDLTEKQLRNAGIFYHKLIMDLPHGNRYLINDAKPHCDKTAIGFTVQRDAGIKDVYIEDQK